MLVDSFTHSFIHLFIHSFIPHSVLRQVHSLFQHNFPTQCNLELFLSISNILPFPLDHLVAAYVFFLVFPSLHPSIFPSVTRHRKLFWHKMWQIHLAFFLFIVCRIFFFSFHLYHTFSCVLVEMVKKSETAPPPFPYSSLCSDIPRPYISTVYPWDIFVSNILIISIRELYYCVSVWYCYYNSLSFTIAPLFWLDTKNAGDCVSNFRSLVPAYCLPNRSDHCLGSLCITSIFILPRISPFIPSVHSTARLLAVGMSVYLMFCSLTPSLLIKLYLCSFLCCDHCTIYTIISMDLCIIHESVEIPTRCSFVVEFIIPKFIEGSTCFERYTAHHQEL
jgi:hypothetical protein